MFAASGAGTVGFATGGETLDKGGAQQLGRNAPLTQQRGFALAQGQSRGAAETVYLSQYAGEDSKPGAFGKKKEFASEIHDHANLLKSLNPKELPGTMKKTSEIAAAEPAEIHCNVCPLNPADGRNVQSMEAGMIRLSKMLLAAGAVLLAVGMYVTFTKEPIRPELNVAFPMGVIFLGLSAIIFVMRNEEAKFQEDESRRENRIKTAT